MTTDEQAIRDRRIAAIRDEVVTYRFGPQSSREGQLIDQRVELLAEVDRLRRELAAVRELHKPEKRYQPHPEHPGSFDTAQQAADYDDTDLESVTHFVICAECGRIEAEQWDDRTYEGSYLNALWPCATARALGAS